MKISSINVVKRWYIMHVVKSIDFSELLGKTILQIKKTDTFELGIDSNADCADEALMILCDDGYIYAMSHDQQCCEEVTIEDIIGDLDDLIGAPLLMAEKVSNKYEGSDTDDERNNRGHCSYTWTFYKLATIKGYVTIRWYGGSNGYYSKEVDFYKINEIKKKVDSSSSLYYREIYQDS